MGLRDFDLQSQPTLMGGNPLIVVHWYSSDTMKNIRKNKTKKHGHYSHHEQKDYHDHNPTKWAEEKNLVESLLSFV